MDNLNLEVSRKFKEYNIGEYEDLRPRTKKMLLEIEEYISRCFNERIEAISILKNLKVNIKRITENTSVSKGTVYNNPGILKRYIDESIKEYEENEKSFYDPDKTNKLFEANNELKELIDKITIELIEMNNLRLENEELSVENDIFRKENYDLEEKNLKLVMEIQAYKRQIRDLINKDNNVINLNVNKEKDE